MVRRVVFSPGAANDLDAIFDYVTGSSSLRAAESFVEALTMQCESLAEFPSRGSPFRTGVRVLVFRRRATIAYRIGDRTITILSVAYAGRDWKADLQR